MINTHSMIHELSEEGLVKKRDVSLQVLLTLLQNPFLKVDEVESMRIVNLFCLQPFDKEWKMVVYFLSVEDSVNHVTAEKAHLNLVSCVRVNFCVLMDRFKDVRCC